MTPGNLVLVSGWMIDQLIDIRHALPFFGARSLSVAAFGWCGSGHSQASDAGTVQFQSHLGWKGRGLSGWHAANEDLSDHASGGAKSLAYPSLPRCGFGGGGCLTNVRIVDGVEKTSVVKAGDGFGGAPW